MPESDRSRYWIAAESALGLSLVVLPASLGGAPAWTSLVLHVLGSSALLLWAIGASRNHRRWAWHPLLLVPLAVVAIGLVQLVPLPPWGLSLLSPRQADLRTFALVPLGLDGWRPIAVDPPSTSRGVSRALGLGMLFFVALQLGRLNGVRRRLFSVLAVAGVLTSLCGFVHLLAGLDSLFGVVHFYGVVPFLTPFGNTNHLAAWLLLTSTLSLGLAMQSPSRDASIGWAVAALLSGVAVFFSLSRGGIGSFLLTWGLVAFAVLARRGGGFRAVFPWAVIGTTVLLAGTLAFDQLVERAETLSSVEKWGETKLDLWPSFLEGIAPYWPMGMGLGGFELGFARSQSSDFTVTFTHPESWWLQWAADFGVPFALACLVLAAWAAARLWRVVAGSPLERAAFLALVGVLLHDLVDFALELNAVSAAAAIVAGLLCSAEPPTSRRAVRWKGASFALLPVSVGVIALAFGLPGYDTAERSLAASISSGQSFPVVRALAVRLINRHPADWVLYANVAQAAAQQEPRETLAWVNRVLVLRPRDASSHVSAANALLRLGRPEQALGELKLAWGAGDERSLPLGLSVARKLGLWERVLLDRPGHLTAAYAVLRGRGQPEDAKALLDAAALLPPSDAVGEEAAALLVQHEAELGSPQEALRLLDALPAETSQHLPLVLARVQALEKLGRPADAIVELERLALRRPSDVSVGFMLVDRLLSLGRVAAAREVLERIRPFAVSPSLRSALFQKDAALWVKVDRLPRAVDALQTASRIEPSNAQLHYLLADVFERMGSIHSALDEVRRGRLLDSPEGARAKDAWAERLEASMGRLP